MLSECYYAECNYAKCFMLSVVEPFVQHLGCKALN
jgi:hypothetical protein